jgi:LAO/AO transport system kinase
MADGTPDVVALSAAVLASDPRALARAITLVESERAEDADAADRLLENLLPHTGKGVRVGVSGPPGAGKSTLIDALGVHAIEHGERVAVLAVDPASAIHGGSLLADKTRMVRLASRSQSFIRPSSSRGVAGGVAPRTREAMLLAEAAGYTLVIVETLGVGQGEHAVVDLVDCLLLVLMPGGGDEIQGMKRGLLELADLVAINKADAAELARAEAVRQELAGALALVNDASAGAVPRVVTVSALEDRGVLELYLALSALVAGARGGGAFERRRIEGRRRWLSGELGAELRRRFLSEPGRAERLAALESRVAEGSLLPRRALAELFRGD